MRVEKLTPINVILIWNDALPLSVASDHCLQIKIDSFIEHPSDYSKETKGIIVLCELNQNMRDGQESTADLYGINVAMAIRRNGCLLPIVFTSFLNLKNIVKENSKRAITTAIGHGFVQLPCSSLDWLLELNQLQPLDELELYDIVNSYCIDTGIINTLMHSLHGAPVHELKEKIRHAIQQSHGLFNLDASSSLQAFEGTFAQLDESNRRAALNFAEEVGNTLIEKYAPIEGVSSKEKLEGGWKLLLLDDEIREDHAFVKTLRGRGVTVLLAETAAQAEQILEEDFRGENQILVVVSDYRLEFMKDGVNVHQPKQGYRFLKEISLKESYVRLVALSALPRKFLMKSFKHYGVRVDVFSKKDYFDNQSTIDLLCEELLEIGNENAASVVRLPRFTSEQWGLFEPFYKAHRNSVNYKENEFSISQRAKAYCEGVKEGEFPFQLEGFTVSLDGKKKEPTNPKTFSDFINKMVVRRVAIWCSQYNRYWRLTDIHKVIKGYSYTGTEKETLAKNQINTNLALSLSEYPWNMTIEEKHWMMYEMGFGDVEEIEMQEIELLAYFTDKAMTWTRNTPGLEKLAEGISLNTFSRIRSVLNHAALSAHEERSYLDSFVAIVSNCKAEIVRRFPDKSKRTEAILLFGRYLHNLYKRLKRFQRLPTHATVEHDSWTKIQERVTKMFVKNVPTSEKQFREGTALLFFYDLREKGIIYANDAAYLAELEKEHKHQFFADPHEQSFEDWKVSRKSLQYQEEDFEENEDFESDDDYGDSYLPK